MKETSIHFYTISLHYCSGHSAVSYHNCLGERTLV